MLISNSKPSILSGIKLVAITALCVALVGCGTLTGIPSHGGGKRFAIEQRLVSTTVRGAIKEIDLTSLRGKTVFLQITSINDQGAGNMIGGRASAIFSLQGITESSPVTSIKNTFKVFDLSSSSSATNSQVGSSGSTTTTGAFSNTSTNSVNNSSTSTSTFGENASTTNTNGTGTNTAITNGTSANTTNGTNTSDSNGTGTANTTGTGTSNGSTTNTSNTDTNNSGTSTTNGSNTSTNTNVGSSSQDTNINSTTTNNGSSTNTGTTTGSGTTNVDSTNTGTSNGTVDSTGTNNTTTTTGGVTTNQNGGNTSNTTTENTSNNTGNTNGTSTNTATTNGSGTNTNTGTTTGTNNTTSDSTSTNTGSGTNTSTTNNENNGSSNTTGSGTNNGTSTSNNSTDSTNTNSTTGTNTDVSNGTNSNVTNGTSTTNNTANTNSSNSQNTDTVVNGSSQTNQNNVSGSRSNTQNFQNSTNTTANQGSQQVLSNQPEESRQQTRGTGYKGSAGIEYRGQGNYQNFNVPVSDVGILQSIVRTYFYLNDVKITLDPNNPAIEAIVNINIDVFGSVRSRLDTIVYNKESVKVQTVLEVMAIDFRDQTLVMLPQVGSYEAIYDEKYAFWIGPLNKNTKRIKHHSMADPMLVSFADVAFEKQQRDQAALNARSAQTNSLQAQSSQARPTPLVAQDVQSDQSTADQATLIEIQKMLAGWLKSWEAADVAEYLSNYSPAYVPPQGVSVERWKEERTNKLTANQNVKVSLSGVQVKIAPNQTAAKVTFLQKYRSTGFDDDSVKSFDLEKVGGIWTIVGEQ